jgi:hypothetical protein
MSRADPNGALFNRRLLTVNNLLNHEGHEGKDKHEEHEERI